MLSGLIVGVMGACIWLGMVATPLGRSPLMRINHCPRATVSPDCGYEFLAPLMFGPPSGILFSIILSTWIDQALRDKRKHRNRARAFQLASGAYLLALGALWLIASLPHAVGGSPLLAPMFPLLIAGLDWAGPIALVIWALLAGAVHASRFEVPEAHKTSAQ